MNPTSSNPCLALPRAIYGAIREVTGPGPVSLHEPHFGGNEWAYLKECLDSSYVSSVGKFVGRFELELANYTGAKHAIAVVNGTAALHLALRLADVRADDEVLIPALTFIASANAVSYCGAHPHLVDSEEGTLGLDPIALREYLGHVADIRSGQCLNRVTGRVIRAVVPMHTFGHPMRIEELLAVARDFHLALVEDAAESLGSFVGGRHSGTFGLMGALSFNGNKTITTGGGGAILTDDPGLAARAKHLSTVAKMPHSWNFVHDEIGYNYRMPNINAALGCAQLEQLTGFLAAKRRLADLYCRAFAGMTQVKMAVEPAGCRSNYWLQTLLLDESVSDQRDVILGLSNEGGLMTRPAWTLMHKLPPYLNCPRMELPVAESLERRIVNLPSSAHLR